METTKKNASKTSTVKAPETTPPQVQAKKLRVYFDGPSPLENGKPEEEKKEYWVVKVAEDQEAMPRYIYRILTYGKASALAAKIAADQNLELAPLEVPDYNIDGFAVQGLNGVIKLSDGVYGQVSADNSIGTSFGVGSCVNRLRKAGLKNSSWALSQADKRWVRLFEMSKMSES